MLFGKTDMDAIGDITNTSRMRKSSRIPTDSVNWDVG